MMGVGRMLSLPTLCDALVEKRAMVFHVGVWVACLKYTGYRGTLFFIGLFSYWLKFVDLNIAGAKGVCINTERATNRKCAMNEKTHLSSTSSLPSTIFLAANSQKKKKKSR